MTTTALKNFLKALSLSQPQEKPGRAPLSHSLTKRETVAGTDLPEFSQSDKSPVKLTHVTHDDGRMSQYPPTEMWSDWREWDGKLWPKRVARRYHLVPTICFNCEAGCGLLAYVDKQTFEVKKFEGNPVHPGSRGRNCAKGPATINQVYDPERILYPLKRVGQRGEGKWQRVSWDDVLGEIGEKMRRSRLARRDGIMYHVGRPGEDHYTNRCIKAWGVDGHNSHTNICSASARTGYALWGGFDRPSPDYANARVIILISSHLETGHYFNPHAQRIIEAREKGAKLICLDPRLSNTASKSDLWLSCWPGSEAYILLAVARHLIKTRTYDARFVEDWVNWQEFLSYLINSNSEIWQDDQSLQNLRANLKGKPSRCADFATFHQALELLYEPFTFTRAAAEAQVEAAKLNGLQNLLQIAMAD